MRGSSMVTAARFERWRQPVVILVAWTTVGVIAGVQLLLAARLEGARLGVLDALTRHATIIALWAAATPAMLWSARRYPIRGREAPRHLLLHFAFGSLFIGVANVLIRIPYFLLEDGGGVGALWRSTLLGVTTYYPLALIVYGVIVAIGHVTRVGREESLPESVAPRQSTTSALPHLIVRSPNRVHLLRTDDIDWIEADDNHVRVHAGGRSYKGREKISEVEARLDPTRFVRVHRSSIVQLSRIREVQPLSHGDHVVLLLDGTIIRVARSRRDALQEALGVRL